MNGLMMNMPLNLKTIIEHGSRVNGDAEIVSVTRDNPRHRYTYRDAFKRANQLASAMQAWGLQQGDNIATGRNDHDGRAIHNVVTSKHNLLLLQIEAVVIAYVTRGMD